MRARTLTATALILGAAALAACRVGDRPRSANAPPNAAPTPELREAQPPAPGVAPPPSTAELPLGNGEANGPPINILQPQ